MAERAQRMHVVLADMAGIGAWVHGQSVRASVEAGDPGAQHVGLRRGFSILDADDAFALVKDLAPAGLKPDACSMAYNRYLRSAKGVRKADIFARLADHPGRTFL